MSDYTRKAVGALAAAAAAEPDYGGWLACVLSTVADRLGGPYALTARRPGSWEAEHVLRLAEGGVPLPDGPAHTHDRIDLQAQMLALQITAAVINGDSKAASDAAARADVCAACLVTVTAHFGVCLAAEVSGDTTWPIGQQLRYALLTAIRQTERELRDTYN